jgi:hypothetical protein
MLGMLSNGMGSYLFGKKQENQQEKQQNEQKLAPSLALTAENLARL